MNLARLSTSWQHGLGWALETLWLSVSSLEDKGDEGSAFRARRGLAVMHEVHLATVNARYF